MHFNYAPWIIIIVVGLGLCFASCANKSPTVPEAEYPSKIVGIWQGTVGDLKESMSINGDGTFACQLYPRGFIAKTLSQSVTSTVNGTWKITGRVITLRITGAENEVLKNKIAASTILEFKENQIMLKSDRGDSSSFQRVHSLIQGI